MGTVCGPVRRPGTAASAGTGRPVPVRRAGPVRYRALALAAGAALTLAGCGGTPPDLPNQPPTGSAEASPPADAWGRLAARVAAARDNRYVASYALTGRGAPARTVTVTVAADGSWLVTIPGGALGGQVDIALAGTGAGLYECPLTSRPQCMRVGSPHASLPGRVDPRLEHVFTDWLAVLLDRQAAISVAGAAPLPGARGECFSVERNSVALAMPMDAGIYCFDGDGTLTAARMAVGSLLLTGAPVPAPATVTLPGPVVDGDPLPLAAPPKPPPASTPAVPASGSPHA